MPIDVLLPASAGGDKAGNAQLTGSGYQATPPAPVVEMPDGWETWEFLDQEAWVASLQDGGETLTQWMETGILWGTPWNPYREEIVDTVETVVVAGSAAAIAGAVAVGVVALLAAAVWFDVK
mgnify:CR=1 FL=1